MKSKAVGFGSRPVFLLLRIFVFSKVPPLGAGAKDGAQLKTVTKDGMQIQWG
jgi:hypothetical protein